MEYRSKEILESRATKDKFPYLNHISIQFFNDISLKHRRRPRDNVFAIEESDKIPLSRL